MNQPSDPLNPYAPSMQVDMAVPESELGGHVGMSAWRILYSVIVAVTLSGTLFGLLLVGIIAIAAGTSTFPSPPTLALEDYVLMFLFLTIGCSVAAALSSFLMAPFWFWILGGSGSLVGSSWNDPRLRHLTAFCGFSSGLISAICLTEFEVAGVLVGLAPGGFSAVVAPFMMRRMLRRASFRPNLT